MMILDALSENGTFVSKFAPIVLSNSNKITNLVCHDHFISIKFKTKTTIQNKNLDIYKLDESALVKHVEQRKIQDSVLDSRFDNVNMRVTAVEPQAKKVNRFGFRTPKKIIIEEDDEDVYD